jgi:hypothetical protein
LLGSIFILLGALIRFSGLPQAIILFIGLEPNDIMEYVIAGHLALVINLGIRDWVQSVVTNITDIFPTRLYMQAGDNTGGSLPENKSPASSSQGGSGLPLPTTEPTPHGWSSNIGQTIEDFTKRYKMTARRTMIYTDRLGNNINIPRVFTSECLADQIHIAQLANRLTPEERTLWENLNADIAKGFNKIHVEKRWTFDDEGEFIRNKIEREMLYHKVNLRNS